MKTFKEYKLYLGMSYADVIECYNASASTVKMWIETEAPKHVIDDLEFAVRCGFNPKNRLKLE